MIEEGDMSEVQVKNNINDDIDNIDDVTEFMEALNGKK